MRRVGLAGDRCVVPTDEKLVQEGSAELFANIERKSLLDQLSKWWNVFKYDVNLPVRVYKLVAIVLLQTPVRAASDVFLCMACRPMF